MIAIEVVKDNPIPTKNATELAILKGMDAPVTAPVSNPIQVEEDLQSHFSGFQQLFADAAPIQSKGKFAIRVYQGYGRIPSIHVRARILLLRIHLIEPSDVGIVQSGAIVVQTRLRFPLLSRVQIRKLTVKIGPEAPEYLAIGKIIVSRHYFSTRYHQPDRSFVIRDYSVQLVITQESNQLLVLVDVTRHPHVRRLILGQLGPLRLPNRTINFIIHQLANSHRPRIIIYDELHWSAHLIVICNFDTCVIHRQELGDHKRSRWK
uniref:Uncharacterized protein n=1 Tax=Anopheles culicifacies TaxID=139723 RepID=A0A182MG92_9DIPT